MLGLIVARPAFPAFPALAGDLVAPVPSTCDQDLPVLAFPRIYARHEKSLVPHPENVAPSGAWDAWQAEASQRCRIPSARAHPWPFDAEDVACRKSSYRVPGVRQRARASDETRAPRGGGQGYHIFCRRDADGRGRSNRAPSSSPWRVSSLTIQLVWFKTHFSFWPQRQGERLGNVVDEMGLHFVPHFRRHLQPVVAVLLRQDDLL